MGNVYAISAPPMYRPNGLGGLPQALMEVADWKQRREEAEERLKQAREAAKAGALMAKLQREDLEQKIQQSGEAFPLEQEARQLGIESVKEERVRSAEDRAQALHAKSEALLERQANRAAMLARLQPDTRARFEELEKEIPRLREHLSPETLDYFLRDEYAQMEKREKAAAAEQWAAAIENSFKSGELGDESQAEAGKDGEPGPLVAFVDSLKKLVASGKLTIEQANKMVDDRKKEVALERAAVGQKVKGAELIQGVLAQVGGDPALSIEEKHARLGQLNLVEALFSSGTIKWDGLADAIQKAATAKTEKQAREDRTEQLLKIRGMAFEQALKLRESMPDPRTSKQKADGVPDPRPSVEDLAKLREHALLSGQGGMRLMPFDVSQPQFQRPAFDELAAAGQVAGVPRGTQSAPARAQGDGQKPAQQQQKGSKAPAQDRAAVEARAVEAYRKARDEGKSDAEARKIAARILVEGGLDPDEQEQAEQDPASIQGM